MCQWYATWTSPNLHAILCSRPPGIYTALISLSSEMTSLCQSIASHPPQSTTSTLSWGQSSTFTPLLHAAKWPRAHLLHGTALSHPSCMPWGRIGTGQSISGWLMVHKQSVEFEVLQTHGGNIILIPKCILRYLEKCGYKILLFDNSLFEMSLSLQILRWE